MMDKNLFEQAKIGLQSISINQSYINNSLTLLNIWMTQLEFKDYLSQIEHIIKNENWEYLLDSFYQVIPFGTGGRRGEVGVGPNRINPWTIMASAQGHSQYLLNIYGKEACSRGIVFAYDVREFWGNQYLSNEILNPVKNLTSKNLADAAAGVYAANGIKVWMFNEIRTTPELSFAIRYLNAVAGAMFSASHNPPDHNGKKVYDEYGGQLIPPNDERLVNEVINNVNQIKVINLDEARDKELLSFVNSEIDTAFLKEVTNLSLSNARDIKIVFTPLHGCGSSSVYPALVNLGFPTLQDPLTSNPSGKFENITFNIPNPEVIQSFDTSIKFANEQAADLIISSDPDADRIGIMVKHDNDWRFLNGNEIGSILTDYVIQKKGKQISSKKTLVKTTVTTNLIKIICEANGVDINGDLLIGFKYIADVMNNLEKSNEYDGFLMGGEESHGYISGNYSRDKDAAFAAVWLAELAAELKKDGKTLINYLDDLYSKYGLFNNYLTEIRMLGAAGREKIDHIQKTLRNGNLQFFGDFKIISMEDCQKRLPIVSDTDKYAKDVLIFYIEPVENTKSIKVTIRPSGTEPKTKMYFEIGTNPVSLENLDIFKKYVEEIMSNLEKQVMKTCYKIIDIDFPDRGFLLFWQLPLDLKMKYFDIENEIGSLKDIPDIQFREEQLNKLLLFLGSNPIEKVDKAFIAKYGKSIKEYLQL